MLVNNYLLKLLSLISIILILNINTYSQVFTLQQCIDTAQINNKNVQISKNSIELSKVKIGEAQSNLIPKLNLIADYKYFTDLPYQLMPMSAFGGPEGQFKETQFGVPHNISANLQLTLPLYNPQIYGTIKSVKIAGEIADLQYEKNEETVFYEISTIYYNAQILYQQLSFLDSNVVNTSKLLENMKLLKAQLMVKSTDVTKVQLQLDQLITQRELLFSKYQQVLNLLKFSMGISIYQEIEINSEIQYQDYEEYTNSTTVDIEIMETQNKFLMSELNTLKSSRLPTLSMYATYGQSGFGYDESPNEFLNFYPVGFVGLQLTVPIFNGTVTNKKISQKNIEIQNSNLLIDLQTEQNLMLIENAKKLKVIAQQTVENTLAQIELAQTIYKLTVLQQQEETATLTDVLLADTTLREAQQTYLAAIIDYLKADLELKKLTGNIN
jgi:OMF family outer membrane factor